MGVGMPELLIVLVIVLLVFGASRLPQIGEGIGKAVKNLKRGLQSDDDIEVTPKTRQVSESSSAHAVNAEVSEAEVVKNASESGPDR